MHDCCFTVFLLVCYLFRLFWMSLSHHLLKEMTGWVELRLWVCSSFFCWKSIPSEQAVVSCSCCASLCWSGLTRTTELVLTWTALLFIFLQKCQTRGRSQRWEWNVANWLWQLVKSVSAFRGASCSASAGILAPHTYHFKQFLTLSYLLGQFWACLHFCCMF